MSAIALSTTSASCTRFLHGRVWCTNLSTARSQLSPAFRHGARKQQHQFIQWTPRGRTVSEQQLHHPNHYSLCAQGQVRFYPRTSRGTREDHSESLRRPIYFHDGYKQNASSTQKPRIAPSLPHLFGKAPKSTATSDVAERARHEVLSFRREVMKDDPTFDLPRFADGLKRPSIWPQIFFVLAMSSSTMLIASYITQVDTQMLQDSLQKTIMLDSEEMRSIKSKILATRLGLLWNNLKDSLSVILPVAAVQKIQMVYVEFASSYLNVPEGKRVCYLITALNGAIWVLWQIKAFHPFMRSHFTHHPLSGKSYTLLTSMFSHHSFLHLLANSFALLSFGPAAAQYLMRRQASNPDGLLESTPRYHFYALYLCAGLFSGLVSHAVTVRFYLPTVLAQIRENAQRAVQATTMQASSTLRNGASAVSSVAARAPFQPREILPSLGASGAIYSLVTLTALAFPDAQVSLLFPPIPMPITVGVGGMVLLDITGILRGWRLFDHWAHLGGASFGLLYYKYGPDCWNWLRKRHWLEEQEFRREDALS